MATTVPDAPQPAREQARAEFADLLRSRRGRLTPADVGLPAGARRRTPGLRREEVAQLAGVSTTYYTFLEQGRDVRPSRQVLAALAHALRLSATERAHLFQLARVAPPATNEDAQAEVLAPALGAMVAHLDPYPAYVKGRRWDVLAANRAARALFTDWMARPPEDRNLLWWTFTDPEARKVFVDWEHEAAATLARFRAAAARRPGDPEFAELIERLHQATPEVRSWWPRHDVLPVADRPEQTLVSFTSADVAEEVLTRLASSIP